MAVLFSWTNRASDKLSYESLKLATELPDIELRKTLWVNINFYRFFFVAFISLFIEIRYFEIKINKIQSETWLWSKVNRPFWVW